MKELWLLIWWTCQPLPPSHQMLNCWLAESQDCIIKRIDSIEADGTPRCPEKTKYCVIHDGKYYDVVLKHEEPTRLEENQQKEIRMEFPTLQLKLSTSSIFEHCCTTENKTMDLP